MLYSSYSSTEFKVSFQVIDHIKICYLNIEGYTLVSNYMWCIKDSFLEAYVGFKSSPANSDMLMHGKCLFVCLLVCLFEIRKKSLNFDVHSYQSFRLEF